MVNDGAEAEQNCGFFLYVGKKLADAVGLTGIMTR